MIKLKLTAMLLVLGTSLALAQKHHPRGEHHEAMMKNRIEHLDSLVDLSDDQKTKIEALQKSHRAEMKTLRKEQNREGMKELRKKHRSEIEAILTDDQKEVLKAEHAKQKENRKAMRDELKTYRQTNIKPALSAKRAAFDQQLTDEERATIESLRLELRDTRKEHISEGPRHKMNPEDRKALKAKFEAELGPVVQAHKAELEAIEKDLEPLRETWEADTKAIKEKHDAKHPKHHKARRARKQGDSSKTSMKYYKFLLMKVEE